MNALLLATFLLNFLRIRRPYVLQYWGKNRFPLFFTADLIFSQSFKNNPEMSVPVFKCLIFINKLE